MTSDTITILAESVEYIYLVFTSDVDASTITSGQVAFSTSKDLPDAPDWVDADVVEDEPITGKNALRVLHGSGVTLDAGLYWWFGKFTDSPEEPIERGPNRIRVE